MNVIIQKILGDGNRSKVTISPSQNQVRIKISKKDESNQERIVSGIVEFLKDKEIKMTRRVYVFNNEERYSIRVSAGDPIFYF